jgi:hypothetical protein
VAAAPETAPSGTNSADARQQRIHGALLVEANALIDVYAQILERTLKTYQGRIKPEEARSLLVTAYIQRGRFSSAA